MSTAIFSCCLAQAAPASNSLIGMPAQAKGARPTVDNTENLPPTSKGIESLLNSHSSANLLKALFLSSVIIVMWSLNFVILPGSRFFHLEDVPNQEKVFFPPLPRKRVGRHP